MFVHFHTGVEWNNLMRTLNASLGSSQKVELWKEFSHQKGRVMWGICPAYWCLSIPAPLTGRKVAGVSGGAWARPRGRAHSYGLGLGVRGARGQGPGAGRGVELGQVTLGGGAVAPDRSEVPLIPGYTGQAEGKQTNRAVPSPIAAA